MQRPRQPSSDPLLLLLPQALLKNIAANALLFWLPIIVASLLDSKHRVEAAPGTAAADEGAASTFSRRTMAAIAASALTSKNVSSLGAAFVPPAVVAGLAAKGIGSGRAGVSLPVLLSSIPFIVTAVLSIWLGRSSQARGERTLHLALPYLVAGLLFAVLPFLTSVSVVLAFTALTAAIAIPQVGALFI